jgi:type I site-specific restriction endonuclease
MHGPTEARTRKELIDPARARAGWDVSDPARVGLAIPVDGFDPLAWQSLHKKLAQRQFSDYIEAHPFSADQIRFLRAVQAVFTKKRRLQTSDLYDPPLTAFGQDAVERWFAPEQVEEVLAFAERLAI